MRLISPETVRREAREAINYYEVERPGLGDLLWEEMDAAVRWIVANPKVPRLRPQGYRRMNLRSFPYFIAYALRGDDVVLLAIGHAARKPEYWITP